MWNTSKLKNQYWQKLKGFNRSAITLESSNSARSNEFHIYGHRLCNRMVDYFKKHESSYPLDRSTVLEIGCGLGRYILPMACRFKKVIGMDISGEIIKEAKKYCVSVPNTEFHINDGFSLKPIKDNELEYVITSGVFQHIHQFELIAGYIKEAARVLKNDGQFLFTFVGMFTKDQGAVRVGAKITASMLDEVFLELPFKLLELSLDEKDPLQHVLVLVRKTEGNKFTQSFKEFPLSKRPYRTGMFDDLESCEAMVKKWAEPIPRLTFYD